jgi:hypothetical protein
MRALNKFQNESFKEIQSDMDFDRHETSYLKLIYNNLISGKNWAVNK